MKKLRKTKFTDLIVGNVYDVDGKLNRLITKSKYSIGFRDLTPQNGWHFWGVTSPMREGMLEYFVHFKFGR